MSGNPCNSKRDWSLHFDVLHYVTLFVDFVLLFWLHIEMTKAEFIFKEDGLDKDGDAGEVSLIF